MTKDLSCKQANKGYMHLPSWLLCALGCIKSCAGLQLASVYLPLAGCRVLFDTCSTGGSNAHSLRVWEREGFELHAEGAAPRGLHCVLAWQPNGRHLYAAQAQGDRHRVVLYETNGLEHGGFDVSAPGQPFVLEAELQLGALRPSGRGLESSSCSTLLFWLRSITSCTCSFTCLFYHYFHLTPYHLTPSSMLCGFMGRIRLLVTWHHRGSSHSKLMRCRQADSAELEQQLRAAGSGAIQQLNRQHSSSHRCCAAVAP